MFEIIKNAPPLTRGQGRAIYPFSAMGIGDSFDAPRDMGRLNNGGDRRQNVVSACARSYAKKYNLAAKFATQLLDENTVRCQRVA